MEYGGNCGNLSAAVALYALEAGLVDACAHKRNNTQPDTQAVPNTQLVKLWCRNTRALLHALVRVGPDGRPVHTPSAIAGVSGSGVDVELRFMDPAASVAFSLLPTGRPLDMLTNAAGRTFEASLVDAATPVVFVRAEAVGVSASQSVSQLNNDTALLDMLEQLRANGAKMMGVAPSRSIPKICVVFSPTKDGTDAGLRVRALSMGVFHKAVPLTAAMCAAAATCVPGSLPALHLSSDESSSAGSAGTSSGTRVVSIHHAAGASELLVGVREDAGRPLPHIEFVGCLRSARTLMVGSVVLPAAAESEPPQNSKL